MRIIGVREGKAGQLAHRQVEHGARREKGRVRQPALDDDLDVAEAIADDGRRKSQRNQTERYRSQLQRQRRICAERPGYGVAAHERPHSQDDAPGNPPKLPSSGKRGDLAEGSGEHRNRGHRADEEIDRLGPVKDLQSRREEGTVLRPSLDDIDSADAEHERRGVNGWHEPLRRNPQPPGWTLGKNQGEVQEQRREQRHRQRVTPVEHPVQPIERPVERERKGAEERHAQPEEMQRGLVAGPPQTNPGAHKQREDPNTRKNEVHRSRAAHCGQRYRQHLAAAKTNERVFEPRPLVASVLVLDDVGWCLNRYAVDCGENIAVCDTRLCGRRTGNHLERRDAFSARPPQDAVLDVVPSRAHGDVGDAETGEHEDDHDREKRSAPGTPPQLRSTNRPACSTPHHRIARFSVRVPSCERY